MPFLRPWQVAGIIGFECIARRGPLLVARRGDLLLGGLHRGMALLLWVLLPALLGFVWALVVDTAVVIFASGPNEQSG